MAEMRCEQRQGRGSISSSLRDVVLCSNEIASKTLEESWQRNCFLNWQGHMEGRLRISLNACIVTCDVYGIPNSRRQRDLSSRLMLSRYKQTHMAQPKNGSLRIASPNLQK
eukprot:753299-Hanusia_phi.AAC.3